MATMADAEAVELVPESTTHPVAVSQPEPPTIPIASPLPAPAAVVPAAPAAQPPAPLPQPTTGPRKRPTPPPKKQAAVQAPAAWATQAVPAAAPAVTPVVVVPAAAAIAPRGDFKAFKQYLESINAANLRAALPLIAEWLKANKELGDKFDKLEEEMRTIADDQLKVKVVENIELVLFDLGEKGNAFANAAFQAMNENVVI
jgi:hypothetical protein